MGKTAKKALIYNPYFDTLGGGERYCLTVVDCLLKKGWKVDFWWRGKKNLLSKARDRFDLKLKGIKILNFDLKPLFQRLNLTRSYDLVFWLSDGSLPFLLSNNNIVHFQVPFKNTSTNKLLDKVKLKLIDHIVCNSKFTKGFIDQEYRTESKVLYPPVDVAKFKPGRKENLIIGVGRFEETMQAKKQDVLIKAFKQMVDQGLRGWRLVLIGGSLGEAKSNLFLRKLEKMAWGYPIEFLVNASFKQLKEHYAKARFFWHAAGFGIEEEKEPWRVEHFGIAPVEAMAAGCVSLVMDKGGLREIVRRGMGERWNSIDELVKKTIKLIKDEKLYFSYQKAAFEQVKDFSKNKFCYRLGGLLKEK